MRPKRTSLVHRPSQELIELRQSGLPWLTAVTLLLLILAVLGVIYLTTRQDDNNRQIILDGPVKIVPIVRKNESEGITEIVTLIGGEREDTVVVSNETDALLTSVTSEVDVSVIIPPSTVAPISLSTEILLSTVLKTTVASSTSTVSEVSPTTEDVSVTTVIPTTTTVAPTTVPTTTIQPATSTETISTSTTITVTTPSTTTTAVTMMPSTVPIPTVSSTTIDPTTSTVQLNGVAPSPRSPHFQKAAVITDHPKCSLIARKLLNTGGSIVDSAIGAEICQAAVHPHATGPAYGLVIVVASGSMVTVIDGREQTPSNLRNDLFVDNPRLASFGYSSICVPGWLSALWSVHQKYGVLPWARLFRPTLELVRDGFPVDSTLLSAFEARKGYLLKEKSTRTTFGRLNGSYQNPPFLRFLEELSRMEGPVLGAATTDSIAQEMKQRGGLITKSDFEDYRIDEEDAIAHSEGNFTIYGPSFVTLKETNSKKVNPSSIQAADTNGTMIIITSTNRHSFGSVRRSETMGVPWNNCVAQFRTSCEEVEMDCLHAARRAPLSFSPWIAVIGDVKIAASGDAQNFFNSFKNFETQSRNIRIGNNGTQATCGNEKTCFIQGI